MSLKGIESGKAMCRLPTTYLLWESGMFVSLLNLPGLKKRSSILIVGASSRIDRYW